MPSEYKVCVDCRNEFEITEGELEFFASKQDEQGKPFSPPKRCKACRIKRKTRPSRGINDPGNDDAPLYSNTHPPMHPKMYEDYDDK